MVEDERERLGRVAYIATVAESRSAQSAIRDFSEWDDITPHARDHWCRIAAAVARAVRPAIPAAIVSSRIALACVRNGTCHLFEATADARAFLEEHGNDWSFAAWRVDVAWHPATAAPDRPGGEATP